MQCKAKVDELEKEKRIKLDEYEPLTYYTLRNIRILHGACY